MVKKQESNTKNYLILSAFGIAIILMLLSKPKQVLMNPQDAEEIIKTLLDSEKYYELLAFIDERKKVSDIDAIMRLKKGKIPDWILVKLFELKRSYGQ